MVQLFQKHRIGTQLVRHVVISTNHPDFINYIIWL